MDTIPRSVTLMCTSRTVRVKNARPEQTTFNDTIGFFYFFSVNYSTGTLITTVGDRRRCRHSHWLRHKSGTIPRAWASATATARTRVTVVPRDDIIIGNRHRLRTRDRRIIIIRALTIIPTRLTPRRARENRLSSTTPTTTRTFDAFSRSLRNNTIFSVAI